MEPSLIRNWLLRQPRPANLRLIGEDTQAHEIAMTSGTLASIAQSCAALQPQLIEAYGTDGKLLRAMRPEEIEAEAEIATGAPTSSRNEDAETSRFRCVATLIADAYRHSTEVAFARLADLFDLSQRDARERNKEMEGLLRLLRKEWEEKLAQAAEQAENADPLTDLVGAFVSGNQSGITDAAVAAAATAATQPKPNGKGRA